MKIYDAVFLKIIFNEMIMFLLKCSPKQNVLVSISKTKQNENECQDVSVKNGNWYRGIKSSNVSKSIRAISIQFCENVKTITENKMLNHK